MAGTFQIAKGDYVSTPFPGDEFFTFHGTTIGIGAGGFGYKVGASDLNWITIDVVSKYDDDYLRDRLHILDKITQYAHDYSADTLNAEAVHLYWAADGEPLRSSVVYDLNYEILSEQGLTALLGKDAAKLRIAFQHSPYWESAGTSNHSGTLITLGGTLALTAGSNSFPARIQKFEWGGQPGNEFQTGINKLWAGIRDTRNGYAGFIPKWEAEHGTNATDASDIADANASNGTAVAVTFATGTAMTKRFSVTVSNIATANYDDFVGRYLVLGRMRMSAATVEVATELRHGWLGVAGMESSLGVTFISAVTDANLVNYNLIPLGVADVPPTGDRSGLASTGGAAAPIRSYGMSLYAERLSAGGSMVFDCFILIPTDHLQIIGSASVSYLGYCRAYTGEDDIPYAINYTLANGWGNTEYSFENWNKPVGGGMLVVAAQGATISNLLGTVTISMDIKNRFRAYQGTS